MDTTINYLTRIKSNYILKKIFRNLKQNKYMNIIKYNKNMQKRINLEINDYKEYYKKIEIEIIIKENRYSCRSQDYLINIKKDEDYCYHIYFNDNNEEIKRNYLNENEKVQKIIIIIDSGIKSFKKLFYKCYEFQKINFIIILNEKIL